MTSKPDTEPRDENDTELEDLSELEGRPLPERAAMSMVDFGDGYTLPVEPIGEEPVYSIPEEPPKPT